MGVQLDRGAHDLVVALVAPDHVDADGDRLVGLVGDDDALAHLRAAGTVLGRVVGLGRGLRRALLGLLGLGARAVAAPLGGGVLAARLALGLALLWRRLAARLAARGTALLEALATGRRGRSGRLGLGRLGGLRRSACARRRSRLGIGGAGPGGIPAGLLGVLDLVVEVLGILGGLSHCRS